VTPPRADGYRDPDDPDAYWEEMYGQNFRDRLLRVRDDPDDWDDPDEQDPAAPPRPLPDGYRVEVCETDQGWYWHLYRNDKRVNGGLAASEYRAGVAARSAVAAHLYAWY
jgi:hypothetical protein